MLKTRVISAAVLVIILIGVVLSGQIGFAAGVFLLSLIGVHEFYSAMAAGGYKPVKAVGYIACLFVLLIGLDGIMVHMDGVNIISFASAGVYAMIVALMAVIIFKHGQYQITDVAVTLLGIVYVVFLFSFVVLTRNMEHGLWLIWFVFIGAFVTDTSAYFAGVSFGKRKILPVVSPKKSLEGSIGGILGCIAVTVLYGLYLNDKGVVESIALYHLIVLGMLNGVISQVGDWAASAIKRYVKIKDYGKLMPGHGGVLDRFDSILFVAPVVYFYFNMIV